MSESVGERFVDEDWYGEELADRVFRECAFVEMDLTEVSTRGARFESCTFDRVRLNASIHVQTAFTACTFVGCSLFDASFEGCRMDGTSFERCTLTPLTVSGGSWWGVALVRAKLGDLALRNLRLAEADLTGADLRGADLRGADLTGAVLRGTLLDRADLRDAALVGADLTDVRVRGARLDLAGALALAESLGAVVET